MKAQGILRHHFWGNYYATIGLTFASEDDANKALLQLPNWKIGEKNKNVLVWHGDGDALKAEKSLLGSFGADEKKIDSVMKSIDFGEPFEISIESG